MNAFTIKDLENLTGIKAHTIRIWEQRYSFLKPRRTDTNIRYYSSDELKVILNIALLNKYGFKISHINRMNVPEMKEKILSLSQAQAQQERVVNELIQKMVDLDMDGYNMVLSAYIKEHTIQKSITQIIFPFLERVGILWLTNHINPAQEHLVSNIIRQKLIVGIDSTLSPVTTSKTALLFLPEGEFHEIGLLYIHFLLKGRGLNVLYLGANVPIKDLEYILNLKQPNFLYTHLTSLANNFNFDKFLTNVSTKTSAYPLVISGQLVRQYKKKAPANVQLKNTLLDVMDYISTI